MYLLVPSVGPGPRLPSDLPLYIPEVEVEEGEFIPPDWSDSEDDEDLFVFALPDGEIFDFRLSSDEEDEDLPEVEIEVEEGEYIPPAWFDYEDDEDLFVFDPSVAEMFLMIF